MSHSLGPDSSTALSHVAGLTVQARFWTALPNREWVSSPGDIWPHRETFLLVTAQEMRKGWHCHLVKSVVSTELLTTMNHPSPHANSPKAEKHCFRGTKIQEKEPPDAAHVQISVVSPLGCQSLPAHNKKCLNCLRSQARTTEIKLVGGTEHSIILCCCITPPPPPMETTMLFRNHYSPGRGNWESEGSLFHRWENRRLKVVVICSRLFSESG